MLASLGLTILATILLYFEGRRGHPGPAGRAVATAVSPLVSVSSSAGQGVHSVWQDYMALVDVKADNQRLKTKLRQVKQRAAVPADLQAENDRLRRLLELGDRRKDLRLRAARVVARTASPYFRVLKIVLEVGDGVVEEGMPVIAPGGVVGQIRSRSGSRGEVLLVTDPRSAIDVVLEKSRARGVAVGTGEPERYAARLKYLQRDVKAIAGERVLTTGDDDRYPRGLVVGEVVEVGGDVQGPFQRAILRPLLDPGQLDEVFVVLGYSGLTPDGEDFEGVKQ